MDSDWAQGRGYRVVLHEELGDSFGFLFEGMQLQRLAGMTVLTGATKGQGGRYLIPGPGVIGRLRASFPAALYRPQEHLLDRRRELRGRRASGRSAPPGRPRIWR